MRYIAVRKEVSFALLQEVAPTHERQDSQIAEALGEEEPLQSSILWCQARQSFCLLPTSHLRTANVTTYFIAHALVTRLKVAHPPTCIQQPSHSADVKTAGKFGSLVIDATG